MRFRLLGCALLATSACAVAAAAQSPASPADPAGSAVAFHIDAKPVRDALKEYAAQAGLQLVYETGDIRTNVFTSGLTGNFTREAAISHLLAHTNLDYRFINSKMVSVRLADSIEPPAPSDPRPSSKPPSVSYQVGSSSDLQEVLVTAQKREERLQDVPVPVSVVSADELNESNQARLQDYYAKIPGLSIGLMSQAFQTLSIRGVTTGIGTNPTVGVTVDDVPFGPSTNLGGAGTLPEIDASELNRIEVLRGPQGTLYGASSMGGLIKFVTVDPSTSGVSGHIQIGTSAIHNGDNLGYNVRGSINVPLGDMLAVRASGFTRQDPGYIDNPVLGLNGVNRSRDSGGRLSALWRPSDSVSLKLSALYQHLKGDGSNDVNVPTDGYPSTTGLGDLQQNYIRGLGAYDKKVQAYSAILTAQLGGVELTAVSGYNVTQTFDSLDYSSALASFAQNYFNVTGNALDSQNKTEKFTQEIRLSGAIQQNIDWLVGAFYTHENSEYVQTYPALDVVTGQTAGLGLYSSFPTTYKEYAAFGNLTFRFTNNFDLQLGVRESEIKQSISELNAGPYTNDFFGTPLPVIYPEVDSKANAFTYLATPRYRISPNLMLYGRVASGYRAGGPNAAPGEPPNFKPDKTQNYEIGAKGDFLDHRLSIDGSLYLIEWKNIQIGLTDPNSGFGYTVNGGSAKSQGLELSLEARPTTSLTIAGWLAWSDAKLTDAFSPDANAIGNPGDRLPYSTRFSGNLSIDQNFRLGDALIGSLGGSLSFVGNRYGEFSTIYVPLRQQYPSYFKADLHSSLKYESWTGTLYVNNVADKRGVVAGGLGALLPFAFTYIQPRTVGISVEKTF